MQIVRCKLIDRLIVFFANRIVGELSAAGKLDTWPDRPGPMASRARQGISKPGQIAGKLDNEPKSIKVKVGVSESVEAPKSIEVGRSGSVQVAKIGRACARAVARSVRRCAEVSKFGTKSRPGATNARGRTHCSFANHRRGDFSTNRVDFRRCRHACEPSKVPRLQAKAKDRHIALRDELLARCYLEKRRKSSAKSVQSRLK